jgi:hypothetical protein
MGVFVLAKRGPLRRAWLPCTRPVGSSLTDTARNEADGAILRLVLFSLLGVATRERDSEEQMEIIEHTARDVKSGETVIDRGTRFTVKEVRERNHYFSAFGEEKATDELSDAMKELAAKAATDAAAGLDKVADESKEAKEEVDLLSESVDLLAKSAADLQRASDAGLDVAIAGLTRRTQKDLTELESESAAGFNAAMEKLAELGEAADAALYRTL